MNGFLVMLRHSMDDLPLFLTGDREEAMDFARKVTEDSGEHEKEVLRLDASTPISAQVYEFKDGKLCEMVEVVDFTA